VNPVEARPATYRELFAVTEFRSLYVARTLSLIGDQLARVALTILVFRQTGSALITGVVYALTFLPYLGGLFLAGLADRRPRRAVMIGGDLLCAVAVAAMALPDMPLPVLCALLVVATLVNPVYDAARAALLPEVLPGDLYVLGSAVTSMTFGAVQVLGFGVGGALVAGVGPREALALDALTFLASALVLRWWTRARPAALTEDERPWQQLVGGARLVFGTGMLRWLVWLAWLNAFWVVPEGLAAPYAATLHAGPAALGLLLAAMPTGAMVGGLVLTRLVAPARRERLLIPLALLSAGPLIATGLRPGLVVSLVLWFLAGLGTAYNLPANAAFMQSLPNERRGQGFALASAGMITGQGLAIVIAGAAATVVSPSTVVAAAGALGLALVAALAWRHRTSERRSVAGPAIQTSPFLPANAANKG
jgi:MFS family permease